MEWLKLLKGRNPCHIYHLAWDMLISHLWDHLVLKHKTQPQSVCEGLLWRIFSQGKIQHWSSSWRTEPHGKTRTGADHVGHMGRTLLFPGEKSKEKGTAEANGFGLTTALSPHPPELLRGCMRKRSWEWMSEAEPGKKRWGRGGGGQGKVMVWFCPCFSTSHPTLF